MIATCSRHALFVTTWLFSVGAASLMLANDPAAVAVRDSIIQQCRTTEDLGSLDLQKILTGQDGEYAVTLLEAKRFYTLSATKIDGLTGKTIPPRLGEHDQTFSSGDIAIAKPITPGLQVKQIAYLIPFTRGFSGRGGAREEHRIFSPFRSAGNYMAIMRLPQEIRNNELSSYPETYLIDAPLNRCLIDADVKLTQSQLQQAVACAKVLRSNAPDESKLDGLKLLQGNPVLWVFALNLAFSDEGALSDSVVQKLIAAGGPLQMSSAFLIYKAAPQNDEQALKRFIESVSEMIDQGTFDGDKINELAIALITIEVNEPAYHVMLSPVRNRIRDRVASQSSGFAKGLASFLDDL